MRAKFGSILDASVIRPVSYGIGSAERKDSTDGLVQMVVYEHVEALRQLGRTLDQTLQAGAMLRYNKRMVG